MLLLSTQPDNNLIFHDILSIFHISLQILPFLFMYFEGGFYVIFLLHLP